MVKKDFSHHYQVFVKSARIFLYKNILILSSNLSLLLKRVIMRYSIIFSLFHSTKSLLLLSKFIRLIAFIIILIITAKIRQMKVIVILLSLLVYTSGTLWIAFGNFTTDNITFIMQTIGQAKAQFALGIPSVTIAKYISDTLNTVWAPAWNVFNFYKVEDGFDGVVYGYGFRNHWLWINQVSTSRFSYIIWKDYNCNSWTQLSIVPGYNKNTTQKAVITNWMNAFVNNSANSNIIMDPWLVAFKLGTYLNDLNPNEAYTVIIAHQTLSTPSFVNICLVKLVTVPQAYLISTQIPLNRFINVAVYRMR